MFDQKQNEIEQVYLYSKHLYCLAIIVSKENGRPNGAVVREAGCCTRGSGFESQVRHGCRAVRPWLHQQLRSKTGRREVPGSFLGHACGPSRSEFSVVFSKTRINTGQDPFERPPKKGVPLIVPCPTSGLLDSTNQPTNQSFCYGLFTM